MNCFRGKLYLLFLSKGPPRLALELVRFARETGRTEWLHEMSHEIIDTTVRHRDLPLYEPEVAAEVAQLAYETGNEGVG